MTSDGAAALGVTDHVLHSRPPLLNCQGQAVPCSEDPNDYVFSPQDRLAISEWLAQNVLASWVPCDGDTRAVEKRLIQAERPLLNIGCVRQGGVRIG